MLSRAFYTSDGVVCCHTGAGPDNRPLLLYLAAKALDDFVPIHDGGYVGGAEFRCETGEMQKDSQVV